MCNWLMCLHHELHVLQVNPKAAESLADPEEYPNLFEDWQVALAVESKVAETRLHYMAFDCISIFHYLFLIQLMLKQSSLESLFFVAQSCRSLIFSISKIFILQSISRHSLHVCVSLGYLLAWSFSGLLCFQFPEMLVLP